MCNFKGTANTVGDTAGDSNIQVTLIIIVGMLILLVIAAIVGVIIYCMKKNNNEEDKTNGWYTRNIEQARGQGRDRRNRHDQGKSIFGFTRYCTVHTEGIIFTFSDGEAEMTYLRLLAEMEERLRELEEPGEDGLGGKGQDV